MPEIVLISVWLIGAWLRLLRQARFYQIEEYMSRRYLRWVLADWRRALPLRPLAAWIAGLAIGYIRGDASGSYLPFMIALVAAAIAAVPPAAGEEKKPLVVTGRVKRLLFGAGLASAIAAAAAIWLATSIDGASGAAGVAVTSSLGFAPFLLAPVWLVAGNALMQPVEAALRGRYLKQAAATLDKIRPKIIGITGSYGKTTTKSFLRDIMSLRYQIYATPKSYNTLMGISLAINRDLADDYRSEYFISEMGAYVEGEIARICQLTPPDIAIVTEIGPQHLERFGSLENIKRAKYELVSNLPADGVAAFNWDNPYIREMAAEAYPETRLTVSRAVSLDQARAQGITWIATDLSESLSGLTFNARHVPSGEGARITTGIVGEHNVTNLLLCIAVACHEGIPLRDIAVRIRGLQPAESRLVTETTAAGVTIINDAYSANPQGVASALKVLRMHDSGKRLLITPGMVELGELQEGENHKLGMLAAQSATDIILIGRNQTQSIYEGLRSSDFDQSRVQVLDTLDEAVSWYQQNLRAGDTVLFLNDLPDTY
ncbi:MAG: UDP-N-acetylmuramoyl-tripeptide--D-alanyl-D-alanine ligase [Anaerolineae bacterium]|nr:UDP-N-acetylmuramoyl-tripeptide--D-alanyl-D-alanine ligase [Anaerolineae bacterium]